MEYTIEELNNMIDFLKTNHIAEIIHINPKNFVLYEYKAATDIIDNGDYVLYDYMSCSHLTFSQLISSAIESGWGKL